MLFLLKSSGNLDTFYSSFSFEKRFFGHQFINVSIYIQYSYYIFSGFRCILHVLRTPHSLSAVGKFPRVGAFFATNRSRTSFIFATVYCNKRLGAHNPPRFLHRRGICSQNDLLTPPICCYMRTLVF